MGFRVWGLGFKVWGVGFRVLLIGFEDLGCWGLAFRVSGLGVSKNQTSQTGVFMVGVVLCIRWIPAVGVLKEHMMAHFVLLSRVLLWIL